MMGGKRELVFFEFTFEIVHNGRELFGKLIQLFFGDRLAGFGTQDMQRVCEVVGCVRYRINVQGYTSFLVLA